MAREWAAEREVSAERAAALIARVLAVFLCAVQALYAADVGADGLYADSIAGIDRAAGD